MSDLDKFTILSWRILENKFLYYEGPAHGLTPVPDPIYDALEDEYKALAAHLGLPPTASDMVGFDYTRPACRFVARAMIDTRGKGFWKNKKKEEIEGADFL